MNRSLPSLSFGCRRGAGIVVAIVSGLLLPAHSLAASRDAVKKAIVATVAVEWRSDRNQFPNPATRPAEPAREEQVIEVDPATGARRVRALGFAAQPQIGADFELTSGVVVSADGLVVVVGPEGQGAYTVCLSDGRKLSAKVMVDDRRTGLRLLKVDAQELQELSLSESQPEVGDPVFAAFCTDRRGRAAAQGMIAAIQRPAFGGQLRLDIAVGQMSAGGPVVDDQGRLIGIIDSKSGRIVDNPATYYALPADSVRALLQFRHAEQAVVLHRGMLGMQLTMVQTADGRERLVAHPFPGSPAAKAGLNDGDELVAVEGEKVFTASEVVAAVSKHTSGEKVTVTVLREGKEHQIDVLLSLKEALANENAGANPPPTEATVNVIRPEQLYVLTQDGKTVAVAATKEQLEPLRTAARALRMTRVPGGGQADQPVPPTNVIRVERSDLEKKLEEVGHNVQTLQQQVVQLTEEIKSLRARLADEKK